MADLRRRRAAGFAVEAYDGRDRGRIGWADGQDDCSRVVCSLVRVDGKDVRIRGDLLNGAVLDVLHLFVLDKAFAETVAVDDAFAVVGEEVCWGREVIFAISFVNFDDSVLSMRKPS